MELEIVLNPEALELLDEEEGLTGDGCGLCTTGGTSVLINTWEGYE